MANVLVVEDEADSREVVSRFLGRIGHRPVCAQDGRAALVKLIEEPPDVIVLDMRMPLLDGIGLLEIVRSYLRWHKLPVIILSAQATPEELRRARDMGVNYIFHKAQFQLADLQAAIDDVTGITPSLV